MSSGRMELRVEDSRRSLFTLKGRLTFSANYAQGQRSSALNCNANPFLFLLDYPKPTCAIPLINSTWNIFSPFFLHFPIEPLTFGHQFVFIDLVQFLDIGSLNLCGFFIVQNLGRVESHIITLVEKLTNWYYLDFSFAYFLGNSLNFPNYWVLGLIWQ